MRFSAKNKATPCISLQIDVETIAEVFKSKFLGVIIDNKLSWKDHISFVCRKVARGIGVLIKARKVLRSESLKCLYYSFIYPYMIYCNKVWGSAYKTNIEPLFILQKRAVRIILGVHPRCPSEPLFTTLKFLNCENIFKYLIGRLMYSSSRDGRSWVRPRDSARGVIPRGCSPYHTSMAVGKGLGRLVHVPSRRWEATCGWG